MAEIRLTEADHDGTVALGTGDALVLALPENPTTGYRWQLSLSPGGSLALTGDRFAPAGGGAPGAGGRRVFTLSASQPGRVALRAVLTRAWESQHNAQRAFAVTLVIR